MSECEPVQVDHSQKRVMQKFPMMAKQASMHMKDKNNAHHRFL